MARFTACRCAGRFFIGGIFVFKIMTRANNSFLFNISAAFAGFYKLTVFGTGRKRNRGGVLMTERLGSFIIIFAAGAGEVLQTAFGTGRFNLISQLVVMGVFCTDRKGKCHGTEANHDACKTN